MNGSTERDLTARAPAEEGVGEDQHAHAAVEPDRFARAEERRDPTTVAVPKAKATTASGCVRRHSSASASATAEHERDAGATRRSSRSTVSSTAAGTSNADERPVAPDAGGRRRSAGLGPQRPDSVVDHRPSVKNPHPRRNRP